MDIDPLRQLRHDLRGRANALMLCASALPLAADDQERLEFLEEVMLASDKVVAVLDKLEALPEHVEAPEPPPPPPAAPPSSHHVSQ